MSFKWITSQSQLIETCFRIAGYAVTSTPSSIIYFGGYNEFGPADTTGRVVEYKNLKWTELGNLACPRIGHRSIKIDNKIYLFGGYGNVNNGTT